MSPVGFDAGSLERSYAFLDDCPEDFLPPLVTLPIGALSERVRGLLDWREALLEGHLPPQSTWPPPEIAAPARQALSTLGLPRFCAGQPDLVDAVLHDLLSSFARGEDALRDEILARLRELEELERQHLQGVERARAQRERREPVAPGLDEHTRMRLQAQAEAEARAARRGAAADATVIAAWQEHARAWTEIVDVFGDLGQMLGRGWDLSRSVLRHTGWADLVRLRQLLERLPQIRDIIRTLGRMHESDAEEQVVDTVFVPVRRLEEERHEVRTPHLPHETRGIERSGEIARMLPAEAALLGHPQLRLLWHARRAERALLTYRVEGVEIERTLVEREVQQEVERRRPRPERGPIIAVLDTSGSMHGMPERVAKALVLEALRTAHEEKRPCYAYMFSGPGDIVEHELDLSPDGVGRLLAFLGESFGGGTDVGVLARVAARLHEQDWKKADVVFVTDGEWYAPPELLSDVARARAAGSRFHGVQIGNRGRTGLHTVCDPVHEFQDWARLGGWET